MTMKTIQYHRILPEISIALLRDSETNKLCYRHRFTRVVTSSNKVKAQDFKDYPHKSNRYSNFKEFKNFIRNKFNYE